MMSGPTAEIAATVRAALQRRDIPARARQSGQRLADRLEQPVRIALLGLPGSGKSTLLNMIAGQPVLPADLTLPTLELRHGRSESTVLTLENGHRDESPGVLTAPEDAVASVMVEIFAPIPRIADLALLEVVTGDDPAEQKAALGWAARRADIAIWCAPDFSDADLALWQKMPDRLKDNGFLAITKADELIEAGTLDDHLAALAQIGSAEFDGLFAVATRQALSAFARGELADPERFAASGGAALYDTLIERVARGRREDIDAATAFVERFGQASNGRQPVSPPADPGRREPQPASRDNLVARFAEAAEEIRARCDQLSALVDGGDCKAVTSACMALVSDIAEKFEDNPTSDLGGPVNDLQEATEIIMLLEIEDGPGPAADALALTAQLQREFALAAA